MKKLFVILAVFAMFVLAACSDNAAPPEASAPDVQAETQPPAPSPEALNIQKDIEYLKKIWADLNSGPELKSDWKAELDGMSAEDSIVCQAWEFAVDARQLDYLMGKATPEILGTVGITEDQARPVIIAKVKQFALLAIQNAEAGRSVSCPERGSWTAYQLTQEVVGILKSTDTAPESAGLDIPRIKAAELAAFKTDLPGLMKEAFGEGESGAGSRRLILGVMEKKGFTTQQLGIEAGDLEKIRKLDAGTSESES